MGWNLYLADNEIKGLITESIVERNSVALLETRFNTFDFWFFYMFVSRVPPVFIAIPLCLIAGVNCLST